MESSTSSNNYSCNTLPQLRSKLAHLQVRITHSQACLARICEGLASNADEHDNRQDHKSTSTHLLPREWVDLVIVGVSSLDGTLAATPEWPVAKCDKKEYLRFGEKCFLKGLDEMKATVSFLEREIALEEQLEMMFLDMGVDEETPEVGNDSCSTQYGSSMPVCGRERVYHDDGFFQEVDQRVREGSPSEYMHFPAFTPETRLSNDEPSSVEHDKGSSASGSPLQGHTTSKSPPNATPESLTATQDGLPAGWNLAEDTFSLGLGPPPIDPNSIYAPLTAEEINAPLFEGVGLPVAASVDASTHPFGQTPSISPRSYFPPPLPPRVLRSQTTPSTRNRAKFQSPASHPAPSSTTPLITNPNDPRLQAVRILGTHPNNKCIIKHSVLSSTGRIIWVRLACPHCGGNGHYRGNIWSGASLMALREHLSFSHNDKPSTEDSPGWDWVLRKCMIDEDFDIAEIGAVERVPWETKDGERILPPSMR
jgi:hypothetical protein